MPTDLNINVEDLFALLDNSTLRLPSRQLVENVFNDMAYKLMEWYDVPRSTIRKLFANRGIYFEELCSKCDHPIDDTGQIDPEDNEPLCDECIQQYLNQQPAKLEELSDMVKATKADLGAKLEDLGGKLDRLLAQKRK
jgi:hypothetical protein